MSLKTTIYLGMVIGSVIGGLIPSLFGVNILSVIPLITSTIGGILGIFLCYKLFRS